MLFRSDVGASLDGAGTDAGPAQAVVDEIAKGGGQAVASTLSQNSGLYRSESWDLVDKLKADPKLDISKIPEAELCDEDPDLEAVGRSGVVVEAHAGETRERPPV